VILVTGATGFIGRRLMQQLLHYHSPTEIACLVKPPTKPEEQEALARYRSEGVRVIEGDLSRAGVSRESAPAVDVVFHLAANIDTAATGHSLDVNDLGTGYLLDWLGERCRGARIVYTSSIAVHDRRGVSGGRPIDESSPFQSRTEYGTTKLRGEQVLRSQAATRGYTFTILRLATVYGPGAKSGGLIDLFAQYTAAGSLPGRLNWPGRTSVIHVDDVARLMEGLAHRPEAAQETYCAANTDAPTVGQLAREIGRLTGHPVRPIDLPRWVWSVARRVACSPTLYRLTPARLRLQVWRLSLIVDDGFWFDTGRLQRVWTDAPIDLAEGLSGALQTR
jgi:nucleoside-diphosphate-sugar epimerase